MKYRTTIQTLALGLLLTLPLQVTAEKGVTDTGAPWYEFEVLVFQRIAKGAGSTEYWPDDQGTPHLENVTSFNTRGKATHKGNLPIPYRPLPSSERRLRNIWTAFRNSRNYRPLYHVAWRQQVVAPKKAKSLYLYLPPESGEPGPMNPPKLEGSVKFGVKRYLHMETDLVLRLPIAPDEGDAYFMGPSHRNYRLQEHRRMRSGKLHYLDHPVLGILVQAERYVPPKPEPEVKPTEDANSPPLTTDAIPPTEPASSATESAGD
jgi:hypothetical protein